MHRPHTDKPHARSPHSNNKPKPYRYFRVVYEDGDSEDMTLKEIIPFVKAAKEAATAAAAATAGESGR